MYLGSSLSKVNFFGVINCIGIRCVSFAILCSFVSSMRILLSFCLFLVKLIVVSRFSFCNRSWRINVFCLWRMTRLICKLRNVRLWSSV